MTLSLDSRILKVLRSSPVHLPLGEIAEQCASDIATIRARMEGLREAGYEIDAQPHLGCRLVAGPDRLIADDLAAMLDDCPLVREILVLEKTDSTNNLAAQLGRQGAKAGLVVFAETQTAGRGRLGRKWESEPRQGLWFSLLLRPGFTMPLWTRLTIWAAVGAAAGIEAATGLRATIKWPNDVYLNGRKAAGILIESHAGMGGFAVVGIGVNVNQSAFPEPIAGTATSLRLAAGRGFDRQQVAVAILRGLDHWSQELESGFASIVASAEERSHLRGCWVEMRLEETVIAGIVENLDENGGLNVRKSDGSLAVITSGEVTVAAHAL